MFGIGDETGTRKIRTQPPILTPLTNSVLVGLLDEVAVAATGAPVDVEIWLDTAAAEPTLLTADVVDLSLEKVITTAGDVWDEAGIVTGIKPVPTPELVSEKTPVLEEYVEPKDVKDPMRCVVELSLFWTCAVEEDGVEVYVDVQEVVVGT